jgi:hypothetical protein
MLCLWIIQYIDYVLLRQRLAEQLFYCYDRQSLFRNHNIRQFSNLGSLPCVQIYNMDCSKTHQARRECQEL